MSAWLEWLSDAVGVALEEGESGPFLAWMREEGARGAARALGLGASEEELRRLATRLGLEVWNRVPQPANRFRPAPLPRPERNDPCPCGSGAKHKRCCGVAGAPLPEIDAADLWLLVVDRLESAGLAELAASGALPPAIHTEVATRFLAAAGGEATLALLEPFVATEGALDARHEELLEPLTEAVLSLPRKADRSLWVERLRRELPPALSPAFELGLAAHALEAGDAAAAREAFARAGEKAAAHPGAAAVEVQLLAAEGRLAEARERAARAEAELRRAGYPEDEPPRSFHRRAADDPEAALALFWNAADPDQIETLAALLPGFASRELPAYALVEEAPPRPDARLVTPEPLLALEAEWEGVWPLGRPEGTSLRAADDEDAWVEQAAARWLAFLARHPDAGDSLRILDDVARAVSALEQAGSAWFDEKLLAPLTDRAAAIVGAALAALGALGARPGATLPWGEPENRPARRLLVDRAYRLHRRGERAAAVAALARLLELDPEDGQELRGDLVTWRLALGEDEAALALAGRLAEDELPEVVWGRVLGSLRLGRAGEAEAALARALAVRPLVAGYLLADDPEPPDDGEGVPHDHGHAPDHDCDDAHGEWDEDDEGIAHGSQLEAWVYAAEARPLWAATEGALAWLAARAGTASS
jgi:tetratricopeptide (TPR) repeat protein